jgi:hypothetical protein
MTEPYDLRSNIKGKPGSQGTLFQVRDKGLLNPQQRWPRGYTPERQAEVRSAFQDTDVRAFHQHAGALRSAVVDTLARSTAPVEDLQGLKRVTDEPAEGHAATYWRDKKQIGWGPSERARENLLHEMGHHRANDGTTQRGSLEVHHAIEQAGDAHAWKDKGKYQDRPTFSGMALARAKVASGVHEAVADDYMVEHYRTGGRKSTGVATGAYERVYPNSLQRDEILPGYNDVRPPKQEHMGPQFRQGELF